MMQLIPAGCTDDGEQCVGEVWWNDSDLTISSALIASLPMPSAAEIATVERARVRSRLQKEAAQRARDAAADEQYERCFSPWNGSHRLLVDPVKPEINTPSSFKHIKTTAYLEEFSRPVVMEFDAQNAFGATIRTTVQAASAQDCSVVITAVE